MQAEKNELSFEQALARLEEIVRRMEAGEETLDGALASFEEGIGLVRLCTERLDAAEQKIKLVTESADGVITTEETEFSVK